MTTKRPLGTKRSAALVAPALKLKLQGYDPIPLRSGKEHPFKGWPATPNEPADITKWTGKALAVRMMGPGHLMVFDIDVSLQAVFDVIWDAWSARWPEFMEKPLSVILAGSRWRCSAA